MNVGSLFSGIGGIEIGFEKQGFTTCWFVEYEPYARAILQKRFPKAKIYGDITKIDFRAVPRVDILTGGFPCQDISNAGKRVGIEGSRSSLWKYYKEAIRILRPRFALIENVSALSNRGLNVVLSDLAEIRYDAEWYNISASSVGAHHRRERLFIIAYANNNGFSSQKYESISGTSDLSEERKTSTYCERKEWLNETVQFSSNVSNTDCCRCIHGQTEKQSAEIGKHAQCKFKPSSEDVFNSNLSKTSRHTEHSGEAHQKSESKRFNDIGRGWWSVEPKLGRVADGISNRLERIRCLGNAVVPQVAEVFAKAIKEKINEEER